jgi:hypothetical protein
MRNQRDVAKKLGGILFHGKILPIQLGYAACLLTSQVLNCLVNQNQDIKLTNYAALCKASRMIVKELK